MLLGLSEAMENRTFSNFIQFRTVLADALKTKLVEIGLGQPKTAALTGSRRSLGQSLKPNWS